MRLINPANGLMSETWLFPKTIQLRFFKLRSGLKSTMRHPHKLKPVILVIQAKGLISTIGLWYNSRDWMLAAYSSPVRSVMPRSPPLSNFVNRCICPCVRGTASGRDNASRINSRKFGSGISTTTLNPSFILCPILPLQVQKGDQSRGRGCQQGKAS